MCMLDMLGLIGLAFGALRIDTTAFVRVDVQARRRFSVVS
jgi:hypothetical protein